MPHTTALLRASVAASLEKNKENHGFRQLTEDSFAASHGGLERAVAEERCPGTWDGS